MQKRLGRADIVYGIFWELHNFLNCGNYFISLWKDFIKIVIAGQLYCHNPNNMFYLLKKDLLRYLIPLYKGVSPLFSQKSVSLMTIPFVYLHFIMKDPTLPPLLSLIAIPGHN